MTVDASRLTIQPMTADDVSPLARALGRNEPSITRLWRERTSGWHEMFVARLEGSAVGSVNVDVKEEWPRFAHLFALGIGTEFQGRGIGSALVARVEMEATERGYKRVFLNVGIDNPEARRLYERLGYVAEGEAFEIKWQQVNDDGAMGAWVCETVHPMFKRFGER